MVGRREDGGWTCVQRDQNDSTCANEARAASQLINPGTGVKVRAHRAKSGYFLDYLFIVGDFVAWGALLAEPEDPAKRTKNGTQ